MMLNTVFPATRMPRATALGCVVLLGFALAGCGDSAGGAPGTYELSGSIEYEGEPIAVGSIAFVPDETQGNKGPTGIATITDGKYKTAAGRGVAGGPYILRITASDGEAVESADSGDGATATTGTPLFAPESEMKVNLPKGETTFDINVPTMSAPAAGGAAGGAPAGGAPPGQRRRND